MWRSAWTGLRLGMMGAALALPGGVAAQARDHLADLRSAGKDPVPFVVEQLAGHRLVVFDDGLHSLVEPFRFYEQLVRDPGFRARARYLFLEVVPLNQQAHLEAYLADPAGDVSLLLPAFQNDLGGEGWSYASYFDLLKTVHDVDQSLPDSQRIKVVAVGSPTYWSEIRSARDVEVFRAGLTASDYTMYAMIHDLLAENGGAGILLTNTRHAYKGIRHRDGSLYWNTMTYFDQRDPGWAVSIRFHAPQLFIDRRAVAPQGAQSTQGLEQIAYHWGRIDGGAWDRAFRAFGARPVAIPLRATAFGTAPYVGNAMLDAAVGQTMADAYDAVIFLGPLEQLHKAAETDLIYTPQFKAELERRLPLLYAPADLAAMLREGNARDLHTFVNANYRAHEAAPLPQSRGLPPLD